jgi:hypothetical protein
MCYERASLFTLLFSSYAEKQNLLNRVAREGGKIKKIFLDFSSWKTASLNTCELFCQ